MGGVMSTETNAETEEEKVGYYSNLSSADLAKQINEDYSEIRGSERDSQEPSP
jgi:hypothetical protein